VDTRARLRPLKDEAGATSQGRLPPGSPQGSP